jgi:hypothetical protein
MSDGRFSHLCFSEWPFQVVPDHRFSRIWADRVELYKTVEKVLRRMARTPQVSIYLIWAWYGAGKSHTLQHMVHLSTERYPELHPVYTVFPKAVRSFLDLYRTLMMHLEADVLADRYSKAARDTAPELLQKTLDMPSEFLAIMKYLCIGDDRSKDIAMQWLRAEKPHMSTLRSMGINSRIETVDDAVRALRCIISLIAFRHKSDRLVWMIDEFQRIGDLRQSVRSEINAGLHSTFNECPNNFSLILSFSVRNQATLDAMLSPELLDRARMQPSISIPPLTMDQARVFVDDLLHAFRLTDRLPPSTFFPFEEGAINAILEYIEADPAIELKPRSIMQAFDLIMGEADLDIEDGDIDTITRDYALEVLRQRTIDTHSDLSASSID